MLTHFGTAPNGKPIQFRADAGESFARIKAQLGRMPQVNRTTAPYKEQRDLRVLYLTGNYPHFVADPDFSKHVADNDVNGGNAWDTEEYRWNRQLLLDSGWIDEDPSEPWHWVYYQKYDKFLHSTINTEEDEEMHNVGIVWNRATDKKEVCAIINTVSGFVNKWEGGNDGVANVKYNNEKARAFKTGDFVRLSETDALAIIAECDRIKAGK